MVQLENLQLAVNVATAANNARGPNNRLQDIPAHVQEIALYGVHHGAVMARQRRRFRPGMISAP